MGEGRMKLCSISDSYQIICLPYYNSNNRIIVVTQIIILRLSCYESRITKSYICKNNVKVHVTSGRHA